MSENNIIEKPVDIHPSELSPEALTGLIESFVLREGTDYGLVEVSLNIKVQQVRDQIDRGEIRIVFDLVTESVSLIPQKKYFRKYTAEPLL